MDEVGLGGSVHTQERMGPRGQIYQACETRGSVFQWTVSRLWSQGCTQAPHLQYPNCASITLLSSLGNGNNPDKSYVAELLGGFDEMM